MQIDANCAVCFVGVFLAFGCVPSVLQIVDGTYVSKADT